VSAARPLHPVELIERTRDGDEPSGDEIAALVAAYVAGEVAPEQMSAWCMAVVFRGLSDPGTEALCQAMVESGRQVDLSALGRRVVDKHSTGGVGDKTTIALAPLVAALGVPVAKMSGRGLGHTGGTLDKLEAIPGFRVALAVDEMIDQVERVGCAVIAQTADLVPADRMLYALRDVTGTVPAPALIAASVMSKKIAAGADAILLDVKVGDGAFARDLGTARELARLMRAIGEQSGRPTVTELTRMDEPLGRAVGNALEVAEAIEMLQGGGPPDVAELVLASAGRLLALSDLGVDADEGRRRAVDAVDSGQAISALERWIEAQGGDPGVGEDPWSVLERAPVRIEVPAGRGGVVQRVDALAVGRAAASLGAGRRRPGEDVDHAVGVVVLVKRGDRLARGEPLAEVHARDAGGAGHAVERLERAIEIGDAPAEPLRVLIETAG
jgi:pyrimidine-nucleoside phosphorylase